MPRGKKKPLGQKMQELFDAETYSATFFADEKAVEEFVKSFDKKFDAVPCKNCVPGTAPERSNRNG